MLRNTEEQDIDQLIEAVSQGKSTSTELDFSEKVIDVPDQERLVSELIYNQQIISLSFSRQTLGGGLFDLLQRMLGKNETLTTLNLSRTRMTRKQWQSLLTGLKKNHTLTTLNVSHNPDLVVTEAMLQDLFHVNRRSALRTINLEGTASTGVQRIYSALQAFHKGVPQAYGGKSMALFGGASPSTESDDVQSHHIIVSVDVVTKRLQANEEDLMALDLSGRDLTNEEVCAIAETLKTNTHLKRLNLSNNSFGLLGIRALIEALKENTILEAISIKNTTALDLMTCRRVLKMPDASVPEELRNAWSVLEDSGLALLEANHTLQVFYMDVDEEIKILLGAIEGKLAERSGAIDLKAYFSDPDLWPVKKQNSDDNNGCRIC